MKKSSICFVLLLLLLVGCGPAETTETKTDAVQNETEIIQLATLQKVTLTNISEKKGDIFQGMKITLGDRGKEFDWVNVTNPTYFPRLYLSDMNADSKNEIIVIL
ncbi:hypothetical protein [Paenibacillus ginsengarvi]|uniref:DUF3221 domain-containing protein n=1 Tax=Paenibacillus ginsengarvi TaxID=400777 RepID=A0A3B0BUE1_9BACL|nr:hypothetical protein [Paenibacillus ginsengarvi]RKN77053.1 hypothetical protein D7M11_23810 [Paenibacillus ginsengarvi]